MASSSSPKKDEVTMHSATVAETTGTKKDEVIMFSRAMAKADKYVYRISPAEEWLSLMRIGCSFMGPLDYATGFINLCRLGQVKSVLQKKFLNVTEELYLLQLQTSTLGEGLIYEGLDGGEIFPHFYGLFRSFTPLPIQAVKRAEKIHRKDGEFRCRLFN